MFWRAGRGRCGGARLLEENAMSERGWIATCPLCKWSALVFTREGAEAARSAHERLRWHQGVTVQSTAESAKAQAALRAAIHWENGPDGGRITAPKGG